MYHEKQETACAGKYWVHFIAGGSGAIISTTVTFPLDVIKTRLQSDFYHREIKSKDILGPERSSVLPLSTYNVLRNIYTREGCRTLFRGLGPNLCSFVPESAIGFYAYGNSKQVFAKALSENPDSALVHLSAAAFSGIATESCTNPLWVVKTRLQLDKERADAKGTERRIYKGAWDCAKHILRQEGIKGLYRGLALSYLGVSEFVLQWALYEQFKLASQRRREGRLCGSVNVDSSSTSAWIRNASAAGISKLIATTVAYPHEVIRTRLRQQPLTDGSRKYISGLQTMRTIYSLEGFAGLYGGLYPHILRVVPGAAILYGTYEVVLDIFGEQS